MNIFDDLRHALRSLRARGGTASFAVLTLGIGLAAAIAIFCVIDAVLLRALPYPQAERLVVIHEVADNGHSMALATPNYDDLAASLDQFDAIAFHNANSGLLRNGDNAIRAIIGFSGGDFFRALGIAPQLGRTFAAGEREPVAVIGHALWQNLLHGRADVLGQSLDIDGIPHIIIGVMPAGFAFPQETAVWTPMLDDPGTSRSAHNWQALARLRPGADLGQARLAANGLATNLKRRFGKDTDAVAFDLTPLGDAIAAPVRSALLLLAAGCAFLLLIAITNTTNLLLALNGSRSRELAVRAALGASGARLARQILFESLLIAASATLLALIAAAVAIKLLLQFAATSLPRTQEIHIGAGSIAISMLAALVIALIVTGAVVLSNRRQSVIGVLRESGRGQSPSKSHLRARALLLIGQTALTTVLLIGAGLLGRSFLALLAVDPGFATAGAVNVQVSQPWTRDAAVAATTARRYTELMSAFARLPGVNAVGGVSGLPLTDDGADGGFWDGSVTSPDKAPTPIGHAEFRVASADYFAASGIPLLRGRSFADSDRSDSEHVALISATAAHATWGERDPIGQRIQFGNMDGDMHILTIVGVVGDVHERQLERAPSGTIYVDLQQRPMVAAELNIVVRSTLATTALMSELRGSLQQLASGIPYSLRPLEEVRASALADRRFSLILLGAFASVALVLAIGGLYGLMAFAVGQREHEFALRQALGSSRSRIAKLVVGSGLRIGASGIGIGLIGALIGANTLRSLLFGVPASDPLTLIGVSLLLLITLLLACLLPARRACAVAPRDALI
ncbi:FtsX-like permease family protein [Pseudolysobacter antarcticus]|uniref:FtsX-like permease family protein n=1 Tax=Pseudolysobacter antarcticus TaxID=2511995 RepID=A0A411HF48_9GAMM|nr:ADOP family duplicated permease [Pseudolysobacter antarcticus]QBB69113.1 FtsX-like permease family protein [Pseudolysobacter antarcticus]